MEVKLTKITADEETVFTRRFGPVPENPDKPITFEEWMNAKARSWFTAQYQTGHRELAQDKVVAGKVVSGAFQSKRNLDVAPGDKAQDLETRAQKAREAAEKAARKAEKEAARKAAEEEEEEEG
jgi:hypothetical protein